jgi:HAD superfamily hydrolase (TIGR01509 family)
MDLLNGNLRAAIFDLDGTLIDSMPLFIRVAASMFQEVGLPEPGPDFLVQWVKEGKVEWAEALPDDLPEDQMEIAAKMMAIGRRILPGIFASELKLLPGVEEVFSLLAGRGIRIGMVTTGSSRFIDSKLAPLQKAGVAQHVERLITRDDAPRIKPAPDPLLKCCDLMGLEPRQCVCVGDADVDVIAGRAAGMKTIAVATGVDDRSMLEEHGPDLVLDSLRDFPGLER